MIFKALVKKQLLEIFRNYFYDSKKKKTRTKANAIVLFSLFAFLMVFIVGGSLAAAAVGIGLAMIKFVEVPLTWLYYLIFAAIAVLLGAFGSVFSTYQGLYLSKDNDLLLSMPIPVRTVLAARLVGVYLMGLLYSGVVTVPAVIVCWIMAPFSVMGIVGGLLYILVISLIVFILSCLLGFCVAKLSKKMKNKTFAVVALSLAGIALYYVIYAKAQIWIRDLCDNAIAYGAQVSENAPFLVFLGGLGAGEPLSVLGVTLGTLALLVLTMVLLSRTFLSIATSSDIRSAKLPKAEKNKVRSPFGALVVKEFRRFKTSPSYVLNCGLGVIFLPVAGVALLVAGGGIREALAGIGETSFAGLLPYLPGAVLLLAAFNDMAAPSVSLEGKALWLLRTVPVDMKTVVLAKMTPQFVLTLPPILFVSLCVVIVFPVGVFGTLLTLLSAFVLSVFSTLFGMALGIRHANLDWSNELVPIKQGAAVVLGLFGLWGVGAGLALSGFGLSFLLSPELVLGIQMLVCAVICVFMWRGLMTKGVKRLTEL